MISEIFVKIAAIVLLAAVAVVLILGIRTLFKGDGDKKTSNKLMQLRVLLQFVAIIVLVALAYFYKNQFNLFNQFKNSLLLKSIDPTILANS